MTWPEKEEILLAKIKNIYTKNRWLIWIALVHFGLLFCTLILAYNSYKEVGTHIYGKYFLSHTIKKDIKVAFLPTAAIFAILYVLFSVVRSRHRNYLTLREYSTLFVLLTLISNLIFFSKGYHILIVLNLSFFYLAVFLLLFTATVKASLGVIKIGPELFLPPILYKPFIDNLTSIKNYSREKPSAPIIIVFIGLLAICALLLAFSFQRAAEVVAIISYPILVIAVGVEIYTLIMSGSRNEKERN